MRLIDADAIIKELEEMANNEWNISVGSSKGLNDAIDVIDNAPTVENITIFAELGEDMADITREIMPQLLAKVRPQGEWIPCYVNFTDGSKPLFAYCKCSLCNKQATGVYKFCPNCGAEMRGGES